MASIYEREGGALWARVKDDRGEWLSVRAHTFVAGEEAKARRWAKDTEAAFAKERALREAGIASPLLSRVRDYAAPWIADRRTRGIASVDDDNARLRLHVLPRIGDLLVSDVRPFHIRDLVRELKQNPDLAPRTIRHIYAVVRTLFADAVVEERIAASPCVLKRGELPAKVDKHAEWRHNATYTLDEMIRLVTDRRVPAVRRAQYALKALAGLRHGEAAGLRWRHYDLGLQPLGRLVIATSYNTGRTKTKVTRFVPVHPVLAEILAAWRLGWERTFGREPTADDLVVPHRSGGGKHLGKLVTLAVQRAHEFLLEDLGALGLRVRAGEHRNRGGHDMRAWFITTAQQDGAHRDLLRVVTHPGKGDVINGYTRASWASLCAEVGKLRFVVPVAPAGNNPSAASVLDEDLERLATPFATPTPTTRNQSRKVGRMTGIETVTHVSNVLASHATGSDHEASEDSGEQARIFAVASLATALAAAVLAGDHTRARELAERVQGLGVPRIVRVA